MLRLLTLLLLTLGTGCGVDSSINSIFVTSADKDRVDVLISKARINLDRGRYPEAEEYAEKAYEINPNNEAFFCCSCASCGFCSC